MCPRVAHSHTKKHPRRIELGVFLYFDVIRIVRSEKAIAVALRERRSRSDLVGPLTPDRDTSELEER